MLYGYETLSLTLREVLRLRVLENRVRRIFGLKKDEVIGGWRKLHNKDICYLCSLPSAIRIIKFRRMRLAGHVMRTGEKRTIYWLLVGKRPLGRPRCRWVDNIKMGLLEIRWGAVYWIGLAQDGYRWRALVNVVMNLGVA
jgi:hypothetical protein